ncbi:TetR/AcrR family transcriptional regulator [Streptomyces triticagri]|uniref:TetR/AcrR family transcriptional regulator n=1 Tax=Streptomyces triticagri TaxID=2293568 RepID=UPI00389A9693
MAGTESGGTESGATESGGTESGGTESGGTAAAAAAASSPRRPARADARRNRARLLTAARDAFAAQPGTASMDAIARRAGVGIGTLYRHFPTREALVEALYATELDTVVACAPGLLAELEPAQALRAWMNRYAEFFEIKRTVYETLRAGWATGSIATPTTRERITSTIDLMLRAGAEAGTLRSDIDPGDVTLMLLGVFHSTAVTDSPERVATLLDLVLDALRPGKGPKG